MRLVVWLMVCCGACSACPGNERLLEGEVPYTRCLSMPAPAATRYRVGALTVDVRARMVRVSGRRGAWTLAAFSGPAPGRLRDAAARLRDSPPDVAIVLGGVGDDVAAARETLTTLSALPFPTFVVPGGRDNYGRLRALHRELTPKARQRLVLLGGVQTLQLGEHEFIVLPGAESGRYGVDRNTCGFSEVELTRLAEDLPPAVPGIARWLLSWTAPGGGGPVAVARTHLGLSVGSVAVARFAAAVGTPGGLYAWPAVRASEPSQAQGARRLAAGQVSADLQLVVPRLGGPALVRSDGSKVPPGFAWLRLHRDGMRVLSDVSAGGVVSPTR